MAGGRIEARGKWAAIIPLFTMVFLLKLLVLAPGLYRSTDFEVNFIFRRGWCSYIARLADCLTADCGTSHKRVAQCTSPANALNRIRVDDCEIFGPGSC